MAKSAKSSTKAATKGAILNAIADKTGLKRKQVDAAFQSLNSLVIKHLKQDQIVTLPGLLKFRIRHRPATPEKMGVNPFTKEPMLIKAKPARKVVKVLPVKALKDMI